MNEADYRIRVEPLPETYYAKLNACHAQDHGKEFKMTDAHTGACANTLPPLDSGSPEAQALANAYAGAEIPMKLPPYANAIVAFTDGTQEAESSTLFFSSSWEMAQKIWQALAAAGFGLAWQWHYEPSDVPPGEPAEIVDKTIS